MLTRLPQRFLTLLSLVAICFSVAVIKADQELIASVDEAKPFATPEAVDKDLHEFNSHRERLIDRCIEILSPVNHRRFQYRQRAAAAYALGELNATRAIPLLVAQLREEALHQPLFITDLDPLISPAFQAIANMGRPAMRSLIQALRDSDDRKLNEKYVFLILYSVGSKDALLKTLDDLLEKETEPNPARRLVNARQWASEHLQDDRVASANVRSGG